MRKKITFLESKENPKEKNVTSEIQKIKEKTNSRSGFSILPPHSGTDAFIPRRSPYLEASKAALPVSPNVISFVYSLDGRDISEDGLKDNHFSNYGVQYNNSVFFKDRKFRKFFEECILEK